MADEQSADQLLFSLAACGLLRVDLELDVSASELAVGNRELHFVVWHFFLLAGATTLGSKTKCLRCLRVSAKDTSLRPNSTDATASPASECVSAKAVRL